MQDLWKKFLWVIEVAGLGICQFCEYTAHKEGLTATYWTEAAILLLPYLQTVLFMVHLTKFTGCYSTSSINSSNCFLFINWSQGNEVQCFRKAIERYIKVNTGSEEVEEIRFCPKFDEHLQLNAIRQKDKFCRLWNINRKFYANFGESPNNKIFFESVIKVAFCRYA